MIGPAEALGRLACRKDPEAWAALLDSCGSEITRIARRILTDRALAEDACQETLLHLRDHADRFKPLGLDPDVGARAWIMRMTAHIALQMLRSRKSMLKREDQVRREADVATSEVPEAREQLLEQVRLELAGLPERERLPVVLHYLGGLDYAQLSSVLRCPVGTAKARVHRCLKKLRQQLALGSAVLSSDALAELLGAGVAEAGEAAVDAQRLARWKELLASPRKPLVRADFSQGGISIMVKASVGVSLATLVVLGWLTATRSSGRDGEDGPPKPGQDRAAPIAPAQPGETIWKKSMDLIEPRIVDSVPHAMDGPLLYSEGRLYFFTRLPEKKTVLVCLDALTGQEKWSLPIPQLDSYMPGPLHLENGRLIFKGSDRVFCADAQKGTLLWTSRGNLTDHPYYITKGVVVCRYEIVQKAGDSWTNDQGICAVESASGREIWKKERRLKAGKNETLYLVGTLGAFCLIKDGSLKMAALNLQTGEQAWEYAPGREKPDPSHRYLSLYEWVEDPHSLYAVTEEGQTDPAGTRTLSSSRAFLSMDQQGRLAWKKELPQPVSAVIQDQDDKRLFVSEDLRIVVLSKLDGARVWSDEKYVPPDGTSYSRGPIVDMKLLGGRLLTLRGSPRPVKSHGGQPADVQCHDPETGRFEWGVSFTSTGSREGLPRATLEGKIYLATVTGLMGLNLANGRMQKIAPCADYHPVLAEGLLISAQRGGVWAVKR